MGGSVIGFLNGFVFHSTGWAGMTAFIIALLVLGMIVATHLASGAKANLVPAETSK
jgi:F0F1-type ATP synthase assembly protein I